MSERKTVRLTGPRQRRTAIEYVSEAPDDWFVTIQPPTRSLDQNARMWAQLGDVARQVVWHGRRLTPAEWKDVFTASVRRLSVVPNLDGTGFVALGQSTSQMGRRELADLIDLITAFGAERGVEWSEKVEEIAR